MTAADRPRAARRRRAPARLRLALLALLVAPALAGCAGLAARPAPLPGSTPQVLVTLPAGPAPVWERHAREIAAAHGLYLYGAWTMRSLGVPCIVYGVAPGERLDRVVRRLASDPRVESAQPVQRFEVLAGERSALPRATAADRAGGDPYAHLQHAAATLRTAAAHRWATGRGVRVAVIDTGVDVTHPDLAARVVKAANFVDRGGRTFTRDVHGTAVAGVLAAVAGNGLGIAGVAPEVELLALKACAPREPAGLEAVCDSYSLAQAVDAAIVLGARVLNLSLSGPHDPLLARLLGRGIEGGAVVVAAADPRRADRGFPASMAQVIAVAAAEGDAAEPIDGGESGLVQAVAGRAPGAGSAPGAAPADGRPALVAAPGADLLTTVPGGGYDFVSGASLAAAQVAGVVALLLERAPELTPAEVAVRLREGGEAAPRPIVVDACLAVARLVGMPDGCGDPTTAVAR
jgi:subtilisin family serine protease